THYGFSSNDDCQDSIDHSNQFLVCNWNGDNYSIYSQVTNNLVGKENNGTHYGFESVATCKNSVLNVRNGYVCNWDGYGYRPYNIASNMPLDHRYSSIYDCWDAL